MDEDNFLFDQTNKIRGGIGVIHKTPQFQAKKTAGLGDAQSQRSAGGRARSINGVALADEDKREIIKNALNRKQISHDYHTTLPKFMKSQGPFAVYEHAVHKGSSTANIASAVTEMALKRHFDEVQRLQEKRISEKDQFYKTMENLDRQQAIRNQHTKTNHARNQDFIRQQILEKAQVRKQIHDVEKLYYKPHFGPEETADIALEHERKARAMKNLLRQSLAEQLAEQKAVSEASKRQEKEADKIFLDTAADTQYIENYAVAKKNQIMK